MQLKIENLEEKVLNEFKEQLNPDAEPGGEKLAIAIATISAKIASITVQKVFEEFSQQLQQFPQQSTEE